MKIKRLAHIGVAVKELAEVERVYTDILPLKKDSEEPLNQLVTSFIPVGETNLELVASTDDNSPIAKFISKKGEGVHHLAFEVDDVYAACEELKEKGVPLTTQEPYDGAHSAKVIFIHPKVTHGVLIELCQYPKGH
jgi:methylmalonyl-CoA/ethylmalonyl-CoA epimerase